MRTLLAHVLAHRARYAALLFMAALILLVEPIAPTGNSWLVDALWNAAHAPLFGLVCLLCLWLYGGSGGRARWLVVGGLCLIGVLSEAVQHFVTGRTASWHDLFNDVLGIAIGYAAWLLFCHPRDAIAGWSRVGLLGVIFASAGLAIAPPLYSIAIGIERAQRFPVLFDPTSTGALDMAHSLGASDGAEIAIDKGGLAVRLLAPRLPGVVISGFPRDWRGFTWLVIDLENPGDIELLLETHVGDRGSSFGYYDRFNARLTIPPHVRETFRYALGGIESAPKTRKMRIDEIPSIAIYRIKGSGTKFVLHSIRLE